MPLESPPPFFSKIVAYPVVLRDNRKIVSIHHPRVAEEVPGAPVTVSSIKGYIRYLALIQGNRTERRGKTFRRVRRITSLDAYGYRPKPP
jgi:hypothetical protein